MSGFGQFIAQSVAKSRLVPVPEGRKFSHSTHVSIRSYCCVIRVLDARTALTAFSHLLHQFSTAHFADCRAFLLLGLSYVHSRTAPMRFLLLLLTCWLVVFWVLGQSCLVLTLLRLAARPLESLLLEHFMILASWLMQLSSRFVSAAVPASALATSWASDFSDYSVFGQPVCHAFCLYSRVAVLGRVRSALQLHRRGLLGVLR